MNTELYNRIEKLVELFFEGMTSNAEERELYDFFGGNDIPPSLERHRELFIYIDKDLPNALLSSSNTSRRRSLRMLWTGIAASLLLAAGTMFFLGRSGGDPYRGSFIIRNGVRITDPGTIRPELEAAMRLVAMQREEAESIRRQAIDPYEDFIREIPDEYTRGLVRDFLLSK